MKEDLLKFQKQLRLGIVTPEEAFNKSIDALVRSGHSAELEESLFEMDKTEALNKLIEKFAS